MEDQIIVISTTIKKKEQAKNMADYLVENRFAACVQIDRIVSTYTWRGKINRDKERRLTIKTTAKLADKVIQIIQETHPYDIPEIIKYPVFCNREYYEWCLANTLTE